MLLTLSLLVGASPADAAGGPGGPLLNLLGRAIAQHFEKYLPPPTAETYFDPKGGEWCATEQTFGGPPPLLDSDKLNPALKVWLLKQLRWGAKKCGWAP